MLFKKPDEISTETSRLPGSPSATEHLPSQTLRRVQQPTSPTQSVIDAWLTITGNLESQGDVRVEGQISGDIRCANLVIGRDATVNGDIVAEEAVVRGRVRGTIRANRVILQETACVESAIYHKILSVEEGASFEGQSYHRQQPHQEDEASARIVRQHDSAAAASFDGVGSPVAGTDLHSVSA